MRKIHVLGLAVIAVFAYSAVAVASASALEWLEDLNQVSSAQTATTEGTLELIGSGGSVVLATGKGEGSVNSAGKGEVTKITVTNSTLDTEGNCGTLLAVEAVKLPWNTQLIEEAGESYVEITKGTGATGNPGWLLLCESLIFLTVEVECTAVNGKPLAIDLPNEVPKDIEIEFMKDALTEAACTGGIAGEKGLVGGSLLLFLPNGLDLQLS